MKPLLFPGRHARNRHVELQATPQWEGRLAGMYLDIPEPDKVTVERLTLGLEPEGRPGSRSPISVLRTRSAARAGPNRF